MKPLTRRQFLKTSATVAPKTYTDIRRLSYGIREAV